MMYMDVMMLLVILFALYMLTLGYILGKGEEEKREEKVELNGIKKGKGATWLTPRQEFTRENVPSGIIDRPSAETINKWNEPLHIKDEKEALSESFANDPALAKLREEYVKSSHG